MNIGMNVGNIVIWELGEIGVDSMIWTFDLKLENVENWNVIYSVGYLKVIAWNIMNYGMKNVMRT